MHGIKLDNLWFKKQKDHSLYQKLDKNKQKQYLYFTAGRQRYIFVTTPSVDNFSVLW